MTQFTALDIYEYIEHAHVAHTAISKPSQRGLDLLPHAVLKAVMQQPSTRTGGSMTTAMAKLGGTGELISGMQSSAEAKGESEGDSWVAFATQADVIGIRTKEDIGVARAAMAIAEAVDNGKLPQPVPVINLGNGRDEHPTQTLGDLFTIYQNLDGLYGVRLAVVGDQERYRAFHSLLIGAHAVGMTITAVESPAAQVPKYLVERLGDSLVRTDDLDGAMSETDVLYVGRNPDEYDGQDQAEQERSDQLKAAYEQWVIDYDRLQIMPKESIVLHPRPRKDEIHPSADRDHRMADIQQMANMIPMRMAIIALALGQSIATR